MRVSVNKNLQQMLIFLSLSRHQDELIKFLVKSVPIMLVLHQATQLGIYLFCSGKSEVLPILKELYLHTTEGYKEKRSPAPGSNRTHEFKSLAQKGCALLVCDNCCPK